MLEQTYPSFDTVLPVSPPTAADLLTPTSMDEPAYLMNMPFSYSTNQPNNIWMEDLSPDKRQVNATHAMRQFLDLYRYVSSQAVVYLLPTPSGCDLQDLVFTANLGIILNHLPDKKTAIISNYTSPPRVGETHVGVNFFSAMGYEPVVAPHKFEGEAELKHLYDNVYIGGYGIRSEREVYTWMEDTFSMKVIPVKEVDPYSYHLDCSIFPMTPQDTLVCTELLDDREVAEIERYTNIIDVSKDVAYAGICNSVRLHKFILNASNIHELHAGTEEYRLELAKNRKLEDIVVELGFEVNYFNLSEYMKGGALLSCMIMHLNRFSYDFKLT